MKRLANLGVVTLLILSLLVMTSGTAAVESAGTEDGQDEQVKANTESVQSLASAVQDDAAMELVAENEYLALYFNEETTEIAVLHKKQGTTWYSNPVDREQDQRAAGYNKSILGSQLLLQYSDPSGKPQQYDNFNQSIQNRQFDVVQLDDGIQITYTVGMKTKGLDEIPPFISEERFQSLILDKIEDEAKRNDLEKRFKYNEEKKGYERRDGALKGIGLSRVLELFAEIGYDEKERDIDWAASGDAELNQQAEFVLPLTYRLEKDQLVVNVSTEQIESQSFHLQKLSVLPFFGAAGEKHNGYMVVPDGSGSLIHLNNGKLDAAPYITPLYGKDAARVAPLNLLHSSAARLPVFGMKQEDRGFVAMIENGDAIGNIEADISGRTNSYNYVYSSYGISASEQLTLSGNWSSQTVPRFQQQPYQGGITIRYGFLQGEAASYSGMAAYYRNELIDRYDLSKLKEAEETPFYLELIGGITKKKFFLGIPYDSYEALTTFEEAQEILRQLAERGVRSIKLRYTGWFNGGVSHRIPSSASVDGELGGRKELAKLIQYASEQGIEVYPDAGFMQVYRDSWAFRPKKDGSRYMTGKVAKVYPYQAANYMEDKGERPSYVLSPSKLSNVVGGFLKDYEKLQLGQLSLKDLGDELNSDYNEKRLITREEAKQIAEEQLSKLDAAVDKLMIQGGNAYSLPYAESVVFAPLTNSAFNLTDDAIPFYEIVLHGFIDYAGSPLNMEDDQGIQIHILKALETGANLNYTWFYAKSSAVKDTAYNDLYASNYADWIDEAEAAYKEVNAVLRQVRTRTIVDHAKLDHGVYATTYEGGTQVIVNYNDYRVNADGEWIEAMGYRLRGDRS